jgi:hypothetical protein
MKLPHVVDLHCFVSLLKFGVNVETDTRLSKIRRLVFAQRQEKLNFEANALRGDICPKTQLGNI